MKNYREYLEYHRKFTFKGIINVVEFNKAKLRA